MADLVKIHCGFLQQIPNCLFFQHAGSYTNPIVITDEGWYSINKECLIYAFIPETILPEPMDNVVIPETPDNEMVEETNSYYPTSPEYSPTSPCYTLENPHHNDEPSTQTYLSEEESDDLIYIGCSTPGWKSKLTVKHDRK